MYESIWRDLYRAAVLEPNSALFQVRMNEALAAINARALDGARVSRDERRQRTAEMLLAGFARDRAAGHDQRHAKAQKVADERCRRDATRS